MRTKLKEKDSYLLDDAAMQRFIVEGFLTLKSDLPDEYHDRMYRELEPLDETGPLGHNNLLPCAPDLRMMLDEPRVTGALKSILGPDYFLHFHRHDHVNYPDGAQALHKDGDNHSHHAIDGFRRYHKTRNVMLLYYPQDTPLEMGPTGIVPRSQYVSRRAVDNLKKRADECKAGILEEIRAASGPDGFRGINRFERYAEMEKEFIERHSDLAAEIDEASAPWEEAKIPLSGGAGTISIVHFDLVHGRYGANTAGRQRHMVKFLFRRHREPVRPSWEHHSAEWLSIENDRLAPVWKHIWGWHRSDKTLEPSDQSLGNLAELLMSDDDSVATGAAYELGTTSLGLGLLFEKFVSDDTSVRSIAAYGIVHAGKSALPRLLELIDQAEPDLQLRIIDVIGDIGIEAEDALGRLGLLSNSEDVQVRRAVAESLGLIAQACKEVSNEVIRVLSEALVDEDAIVVRNATFSISQLGAAANTQLIVERIDHNLSHWHHHVRGWSIETLQRLENPLATRLALNYLMAARWDPAHKSGDIAQTTKVMHKAN